MQKYVLIAKYHKKRRKQKKNISTDKTREVNTSVNFCMDFITKKPKIIQKKKIKIKYENYNNGSGSILLLLFKNWIWKNVLY